MVLGQNQKNTIMVIHMLVGVIDPAGAGSEPDGVMMRTLRLMSPVRHAIEALCLTELKDLPFARMKGGWIKQIAEGPKMGGLAGVHSGNDVLEKLGILTEFTETLSMLATLALLHLLAAAVALIVAAPRFARAQPRRP